MDDLNISLKQYQEQLSVVEEALKANKQGSDVESLLALQSDLQQLIDLTKESLDAINAETSKVSQTKAPEENQDNHDKVKHNELDNEYALFMQEMENSGAYNEEAKPECSKQVVQDETDESSDIEDELANLLGMKCAVYHTHKWGGQPTLHNAMVSAVEPHENSDQFKDLEVRVLYTHPTHPEMLPCPFYLDGECKFDDEKCRYSHGAIVKLSSLKEAIAPDFNSIKVGSRILLKYKPEKDMDISLTKKSTEKYHLWHSAIVKSIDLKHKNCTARMEHSVRTGEKRKSVSEEVEVNFEDLFPLSTDQEGQNSDSDSSLSDTEYPESKSQRTADGLQAERDDAPSVTLLNHTSSLGDWEKHTRGIGSKLLLAMGYVAGAGLGAHGAGRVQPVQAYTAGVAHTTAGRRTLPGPAHATLDVCMALREQQESDPLKVEQRLKRLQKREDERHLKAYEREKEKERRNVFNFINRTLGDKSADSDPSVAQVDVKQSTSKDLNITQFKITEDSKKLEKEIDRLNCSLGKYVVGSAEHRSFQIQVAEKTRELQALRDKEVLIIGEQRQRRDKQKMTVF